MKHRSGSPTANNNLDTPLQPNRLELRRPGLGDATINDQLAAFLAERVMGWSVGPDRFMTTNRGWMPRWRFQPAEKLDDAFRLLEGARPEGYSICGDDTGNIHVQVRIAGRLGEARGTSKALVITHAIARAVGIEVEP